MKDISLMIETVKLNYRTGLMILKNNQVLVEVSPIYNSCIFPGGRVKTLESTMDTLIRELKEEMHVTIDKNEREFNAFIENFFELDMIKYHELYALYKLEAKDNRFDDISVNYDSDTNYYKWVDIDKLDSVNLLPKELKDLVNSNSFKHIIVNDL